MLMIEVPSSWMISVVLLLPLPPINIIPDGEAQLEWRDLIMKIVLHISLELTSTVRNMSDDSSRNVISNLLLIFNCKITSPLAVYLFSPSRHLSK